MKICSVTFSNINSLAGTFSVDLTHPVLTDSGLFLITGATGAGKSTLLDAIAFALYGCTPRQKKISADANEIMSRHFSECRSEVEFEHEGVRYVATAEQKRSTGASPFAPMQRRLERRLPDGTVQLIADRKNDMKAAIERITGMPDVGAFCRCMMLPQGDFSRFMSMATNERAALLSTITQTEVYSSIGELVLQRAGEAKREAESLQEEPTLPQEQRAALEETVAAQTAAEKELTAAAESCKSALAWLAEDEKRLQDFNEAETARCRVAAAQKTFEAAGYAERLSAALRAAAVEPTERRREEETAKRRLAEETLGKTRTQLEALTPQLTAAETACQAAEQALKERLPQLAEARRAVQQELRPAERRLAEARTRAAEQDKQAAKAAARQQKTAEAYRKTTQEIAALQAELQTQRKALAALAPYAELGAVLADIKVLHHAWGTHRDSCNIPLAETPTLATQAAELAAAKAALLGQQTPEEYRLLAAALTSLQQDSQLLQRQQEQYAAAEHAKKEAEAALTAAEAPLAEAAKQLEVCSLNESNTRSLASIQEALDECYRKFCEGEYAVCPCCGSAAPGQRRSVGQSDLQKAEQMTRAAERELRRLEQQRRTRQTVCAAAEGRLTGLAGEIAHLRTKTAAALQELHWEALPADLAQRAEQAARTAEQGDALCKRLALAEEELAAARARDAFHSALRPFAAELPATYKAATAQLKALEQKAVQYKSLSEALQLTAARAEERCKAQAAEEQAAVQAEADCRNARSEAAALHRSCKEQQDELCRRWKGQTADAAEKQFNEEESALRTAESKALQQAHTLQQRHAALTAQSKAQSELVQELQHAEAEQMADFIRLLSEQAFADAAAYEQAKMPVADREALQDEQKRLREAVVATSAHAEAFAKALQQHRESRPAVADKETLVQRSAEYAARLRELREQLQQHRTELAVDDRSREKNRHLQAEKKALSEAAERWQLLRAVLGGSADGFQKYAQSITFDALIASANAHLRRLFPRFLLRQDRAKGELGLNVIDLCLSDTEARSVSNLSGGETFIVSLALALGLSGLTNSRVSIDTLFLDEGFGTLDADNLHRVLGVLEQLKQDGKLIGIITHVEELKDKFPPACNIQVEKLGDSGYSTLNPENPAVTAAPATLADRGTTPRRKRRAKKASS